MSAHSIDAFMLLQDFLQAYGTKFQLKPQLSNTEHEHIEFDFEKRTLRFYPEHFAGQHDWKLIKIRYCRLSKLFKFTFIEEFEIGKMVRLDISAPWTTKKPTASLYSIYPKHYCGKIFSLGVSDDNAYQQMTYDVLSPDENISNKNLWLEITESTSKDSRLISRQQSITV